MPDNSTDLIPPDALRDLNQRMRTGADGSRWFVDDDNQKIIDTFAPGCPNADVKGAARWLRAYRPELWSPKAPETAPTVPPVTSTSTAVDVMAAVRSGSMTADEATRRLMVARPAETRPAPGISDAPAYGGDTMTALMSRAKSGDKSAISAITAKYLNPNR